MRKKAIIFDMDGLLIDSETVSYKGFIHVLKKYDLTMELEYYKTLIGTNRKSLIKNLKNEYGKDFDANKIINEIHIFMEEYFKKNGVKKKKGLMELLEYIKKNNYKTVVATSSERKRADALLEQALIKDYFDYSITGDEVENGKPNPEIFLKACKKLGINTKEAFVLEDSEMGILAGANAGIDVICVPDIKYPDDKYKEMTYALVNDLSKVIDILENLSK